MLSAVHTSPAKVKNTSLNRNKQTPHPKLSGNSKQNSQAPSSLKSIGNGGSSRRTRSLEPPKPTSAIWAAKNQVACDKLRDMKNAVDKAVREHKIFAAIGCFPSIRDALKQRGWMEKTLPPRAKRKREPLTSNSFSANAARDSDPLDDFSLPPQDSVSLTSLAASSSQKTDAALRARLLRRAPVNFFWSLRSDAIDWKCLPKKQIVNRFPRAYFTTKVGLCNYLQQMHWFYESGVSQILFPRCYNIGPAGEDLTEFKKDYQLTACISLLTWLMTTFERQGEDGIKSPDGRIPHTVVEFAIARLKEYISTQSHEDIDKAGPGHVWEHQWNQFLTCYYMVTSGNHVLCSKDELSFKDLYMRSKQAMQDLKRYWPQLAIDGMLNIWIVKPGNKSRGRGIMIMNKLEDIINKVNPAMMNEARFVVQKYIEHPLLIHNTKFDIRQWFLVTSANPLTIWMYKESYLRFCSQSFNLKNMHESVHLCNNAIQARYKNGIRESKELPDENMWDCYTFKTYLKGIGQADTWDKLIYPRMREGIVGTLLTSQEYMDGRVNCFELFGADFMLTEDFSPWLIEINSCPCMAPSTSVTARMCAQCLEDVIKVVVDRRNDRNASTGMFEMVYKQSVPPAPPYLGVNLAVQGQKIQSKVSTKKKPQKREVSDDGVCMDGCSHPEANAKIKHYVGPIVVDLIEDLARHLDKASRSLPAQPKEKQLTPKKKLKKSIKKSSKATKKGKKVTKVTGFTIEDDYQEEDFSDCLLQKPLRDVSHDNSSKDETVLSGSPLSSSLNSLTENSSSDASECSQCEIDQTKEIVFTPESLRPKSSTPDDQQELPEKDYKEPENDLNTFKVDNHIPKYDIGKQPDNETKKLYSDVSLNILSKYFQHRQRKPSTVAIDSPILENSSQKLSEKLKQIKLSGHDLLKKMDQLTANDYDLKGPMDYVYSRGVIWDDHLGFKSTISDIVTKLSKSRSEKDIAMANKELKETLSNSLHPEQEVNDSLINSKDETRRQPSFLGLKINDEFSTKKMDKGNNFPRIRIGLSPQVYNTAMDNSVSTRTGMPIVRQKSTQKLATHSRSTENFYAIGMSCMQLQTGGNAKESLIMALGSIQSSAESQATTAETTMG